MLVPLDQPDGREIGEGTETLGRGRASSSGTAPATRADKEETDSPNSSASKREERGTAATMVNAGVVVRLPDVER